jgi:hypothetical protein
MKWLLLGKNNYLWVSYLNISIVIVIDEVHYWYLVVSCVEIITFKRLGRRVQADGRMQGGTRGSIQESS